MKNGTNLVYTEKPTFDSSREDYELYVPYTDPKIDDCNGFRLATSVNGIDKEMWAIHIDGNITTSEYDSIYFGVRPVVSIPNDITIELIDGVWKVIK